MPEQKKILLLDDEQDLLDMYREILTQLPSKPDVHTSNSGARALALLESETFALLISDLNMPKMDGLQVLSVVRRKFPKIKVIVMTSVMDETYRSRAYAMGVDLFWQKPGTTQEIELFKECVESLLTRETEVGGFRGVQSKSLVDIIQLECLSQSSSVLKITNAGLEGRIWVQNGDVIDAEAKGLSGEPAFKEIFSWKAGNFEILPADPARARTIFNSYQGLLLDTAQAMDEAGGPTASEPGADGQPAAPVSALQTLSRFKGVEFVLTARIPEKGKYDSWGLENPEPMAEWARKTQERFHSLGEKLQAGEMNHFLAIGPQRHVGMVPRGDDLLCVGFQRTLSTDEVRDTLKSMVMKWAS